MLAEIFPYAFLWCHPQGNKYNQTKGKKTGSAPINGSTPPSSSIGVWESLGWFSGGGGNELRKGGVRLDKTYPGSGGAHFRAQISTTPQNHQPPKELVPEAAAARVNEPCQ